MKYLYSLLLGMVVLSSNAQPTFNYTYKNDTFSTYPLGAYCSFSSVEITDSIFFVIGNGLDSFPVSNSWQQNGIFYKMTNDGQVVLKKMFGNSAIQYELDFNTLIKTSDGNLVFGGQAENQTLLDWDALLVKVTPNGDTIWTKKYDTVDSLLNLEVFRIVESKDKGFYLLVRTINYNTNAPYSLRTTIIKTDNLGNEQWRYMYNPTFHKRSTDSNIIEVGDKLIVLGGKIRGNILVDWNLEAQTYIRKIDSTGTLYGEYLSDINEYISVWDGIQTQDGGFVFCGVKATQINVGGGPDYLQQGYIAKVDSSLQLLWEKDFGKPDRWGVDYAGDTLKKFAPKSYLEKDNYLN